MARPCYNTKASAAARAGLPTPVCVASAGLHALNGDRRDAGCVGDAVAAAGSTPHRGRAGIAALMPSASGAVSVSGRCLRGQEPLARPRSDVVRQRLGRTATVRRRCLLDEPQLRPVKDACAKDAAQAALWTALGADDLASIAEVPNN